MNMKTYKIISQKDLEKFKDGFGYKIDGNAEFSYTAIFDGRLEVEGYLEIKAGDWIKAGDSIEVGSWIKAGYSIKAGSYIEAGSWIEAGDSIKAGDSIEAGDSIKAGGLIEAGYSIKAGSWIKAGYSIKAGSSYGIQAGLNITCKGTLSFGSKAFAGINTWREISNEEKTITCSKMIGGGVVEYGLLVETGETEKMIELSNGKKVSESTIIEALRALTE